MEDNRKKVIVPLIIGILCMFILLGGATYAYFVTNTTNSFGTKTITGQADATGSVVLVGANATLSLDLSRSDMVQGANDITYWATSNGTPSTTENVVTVASTSVTGAGYYNCNYTLNVAASGTNNMYTAFQGMSGKSTEQIVLNIGENTYDFNTANLFPITVSGTLNGVSSSSVQNITAEFYLKNKSNVNQRALAGTDISITITATSFSCIVVEQPTPEVLLSLPGNIDNITKSLVGGLYRYQGTDIDNNYICFGTTNATSCKNNNVYYMYRIIGINESGQMKIIKDVELDESISYTASEHDNANWSQTIMYSSLNGNSFLNNTTYIPSGWSDKISYTNWKYGTYDSLIDYNGDSAYTIENGWNTFVNAKIGLMYIHDYFMAYPGGNPGNASNASTAWIHESRIESEGIMKNDNTEYAFFITDNGYVYSQNADGGYYVRPVFYLNSNVEIASGVGSANSPYILAE